MSYSVTNSVVFFFLGKKGLAPASADEIAKAIAATQQQMRGHAGSGDHVTQDTVCDLNNQKNVLHTKMLCN